MLRRDAKEHPQVLYQLVRVRVFLAALLDVDTQVSRRVALEEGRAVGGRALDALQAERRVPELDDPRGDEDVDRAELGLDVAPVWVVLGTESVLRGVSKEGARAGR